MKGRGDEVEEVGDFCFASHPCGGRGGGDFSFFVIAVIEEKAAGSVNLAEEVGAFHEAGVGGDGGVWEGGGAECFVG